MSALYNENDAFAAAWIANLVSAKQVAFGSVDTRSIIELTAKDVQHASQAHFFAGVGVWSAAARRAGWPDDAALWTGSCPCQPFSQAGRGKGVDDKRHLWPEWYRLIRECRPPVIVGEQVASPASLLWLDTVFADMEKEGYACAAVDFSAASVGAPHQRQRLYFMAIADDERCQRLRVQLRSRQSRQDMPETRRGCSASQLADMHGKGSAILGKQLTRNKRATSKRGSKTGKLVHSHSSGSRRGARAVQEWSQHGSFVNVPGVTGATRGFWAGADWLLCRDGKARAVEPGTFPLANGATSRVGRVRAYGNAIVLPQAQIFLEVVTDILTSTRST